MKRWLALVALIILGVSVVWAAPVVRPLGVQDLWFHTTDNGPRETATFGNTTRYRIEGNDILWSNRYLITIRPKNVVGDGTGSISGYSWFGDIITPEYLGTGTPDINKYLRGDGSWAAVTATGGGDMFKSIYDADANNIIDAAAGGTGLNTSASTGAPYLSSGTWVIQSASTFRTQIGLEIGTNVQAYSADLATIVGAGPWTIFHNNGSSNVAALDNGAAGTYLKWNGSAYVWDTPTGAGDMLQSTYDANTNSKINASAGGTDADSSAATGFPYVTAGAWSFIDAATGRTNLGLGTIATQSAASVNITGGAVNGVTIGGSTPAAGSFTSLTRGAVSDTEISYLDGVTSGIQTQLNSKIAASTNLNILTVTSYPNAVWYTNNSGIFTNLGLGANNTFLKSQGASSPPVWATVAGAGTVTGPASSTDNAIALWDGPSGTVLKNSNLTFTPDTGLSVPQGTAPGELRLLEGSAGGTNYVGFVAPSSRNTNLLYSLPSADPSANAFFFLSAPSGGTSTASYGYFGTEFTNSGGTVSLTTLGVGVGKLNASGTPSASTYLRGDGTWAAVSVETIPYSASPTVDAAGKIAIDTTADQLKYYGGAAKALDVRRTEPATFKAPVSGDKAKWRVPFGATVSSVGCVTDAATSAVLDVQECNSNGASCTTMLTSTITCGTTYACRAVSGCGNTMSDYSVAAGNYVFFSVGTVTGSVGFLYVDFNYSVTGE